MNNNEEFLSLVEKETDRDEVQAILDETRSIQIDWGEKELSVIGQEVRSVMQERHPDLSPEALKRLGNYYTYLVK